MCRTLYLGVVLLVYFCFWCLWFWCQIQKVIAREYWALNPVREQVYVYTFEEEEIDLKIYGLDEEVPVHVFAGDLLVPFAAIREAASAFTG